MIQITFDSIIYNLQKWGGASCYWKNLVFNIKSNKRYAVSEIINSKWFRYLPIFTKSDIFHSSHFRGTIQSSARIVSTCHDLTYELGYLGKTLKSNINIFERKKSYFSADAIICISENTKKDLLQVYPELISKSAIYVIHHGTSKHNISHVLLPQNLKKNYYLLYVGNRGSYKNFNLALFGFYESKLWQCGFMLVCTGNDFKTEEVELFKKLGIEKSVVCVGLINETELHRLFSDAFCTLYTSRYEGFGLPLVEAMSAGCPVICVKSSCIPEIVGNAAIMVDADSPDQVAKAILNLTDPKNRTKYIEAGLSRSTFFSWEDSALKHMHVYETLLNS